MLSNLASGNFVDADGVLLVAHGPRPTLRPAKSPPATSIGTVPPAGTSTTQKTSTPTVSINSVSAASSGSVNVTYSQNPPAQAASSSTSSVVDLALSDLVGEGLSKKKGQS